MYEPRQEARSGRLSVARPAEARSTPPSRHPGRPAWHCRGRLV